MLSRPIAEGMLFPDPHLKPGYLSPAGFQSSFSRPLSVIIVPYWLLILVSGTFALLLQLHWPPRFTLRSEFVVTTFLAIVLGMIAWLDRAWIGK